MIKQKLYESILDELSYDLERVLDKYSSGENRLPANAVIGLFVSKAMELSLEMQGISFHQLREVISKNGV